MKMNKKYMLAAASAALCLTLMAGCGGAPAAGSTAPAGSAVAPVASPAGNVSAGIAGNSGDYITEEQAKAAALGHAGVAEADVQFLRVRLDYDNGRAEYDVEFIKGKRILMVDDVYGGGGTTKALNELARQAEAIVAAHAVVGVIQ